MMHEILALPPEGTTLSADEIDRGLRADAGIYRDGEARWTYGNPQTSVGFTLLWNSEPSPYLSCRIPCPRPPFFAREASALMRNVSERLPLRLEGVETFDESNVRAAAALSERGIALPRWPADEAARWWHYMRVHAQLLQRFDAAGVFAPRIFLFADRRSGPRVRTAIAWCDAQATVFPVCDSVLILDRSAEPTQSGQDTVLRGIVDRARVFEALGEGLSEERSVAGTLRVLGPKAAPTMRKAFFELPVDPPPSPAEFEGITADRPLATV